MKHLTQTLADESSPVERRGKGAIVYVQLRQLFLEFL